MLLTLLLTQGTAGPGLQTLTPARFDNSNQFFAPTVTRGAVTLTAARFDSTQTFYAATVLRGAVTLNATRFDNAQSFFAPTVGRGTVTLTPTRFDNGQTFYAATVSQSGGGQALLPSLYTNDQTFYTPTVGRGAVSLTPGLLANDQTFYVPTVTPGAVTITPPTWNNTLAFYSATVGAAGGATQSIIFPDWVDSGWVESGWVGWPYFNANQFFGAEVTQSSKSVSSGRRGYIFKGKRYWLNQVELAQLIREEEARISDVMRLKRNKPKTISPDTAKAIEAIIASLNLPVEPIAPTIDNDDDETMELLLTL